MNPIVRLALTVAPLALKHLPAEVTGALTKLAADSELLTPVEAYFLSLAPAGKPHELLKAILDDLSEGGSIAAVIVNAKAESEAKVAASAAAAPAVAAEPTAEAPAATS